MYIHSVKLINFKSLGKELNEIIVEPGITTIIGKNESGKSNILDGLSYISFFDAMSKAFNSEYSNRNNGTNASISYEIVLKCTPEDGALGLQGESKFIISKTAHIATGEVFRFFCSQTQESIQALIDQGNPFKLKDGDLSSYRAHISSLHPTDGLCLHKIKAALAFLYTKISNAPQESQGELSSILDTLQCTFNTLEKILPVVFLRDSNKVLKSSYSYDDVKKELTSSDAAKNSLLFNLVSLIGIAPADFISAVQNGTSGSKISIRDKIKRAIDFKINSQFQAFYSVENIWLDIYFDTNTIAFSVRSNEGEALALSERSNGLRWYLNTFIDALSNGVANSKVLYLFDEPGMALHVNAQKELIALFKDLASKGNQIIYTTHSPHMIDLSENGLHRIRSIVKDSSGFTFIYKNAYDSRISTEHQHDTFAPIVNAIGMNLQDAFGPNQNKLNIICEGVSDYIYLHTFYKLLCTDRQNFNIIPAMGVTNSINICNILTGWRCDFVAVFDFDKEGVEKGGNKLATTNIYSSGTNYIYLQEINDSDITEKKYNISPYMIEDLIGRSWLQSFIAENGLATDADKNNKVLLAKMLCTAIESGKESIPEDTKDRFLKLFERITSSRATNE